MSALEELRENLREAAQRDIEAKRVRSRRRNRRATGLIALVLLGGGAVATAADLIAVGEPAPDIRVLGPTYRPPPGLQQLPIAVKATIPGDLPYGVGTYKANNGELCAVAGTLRGYVLGTVTKSGFQPYKKDTVGICKPPVWDAINDRGRTIVYGLAAPGMRWVSIDGVRHTPQKDGAFMAVYKGVLPRNGFDVTWPP